MPILDKEPALFPSTLLSDGSELQQSRATSPAENNSDPDPGRPNWWCVYTRSRREKALARKLYAHEVPFYLPLVEQSHLYRGRKRNSYLPLLGGYMFLFGNEDERVTALTTNCISRMLPVEEPEKLVRDLLNLHRLIEAAAPLTVEQRLEPGRRVRVKSGSMEGIEGMVVERRGSCRLIVQVQMLNQGASVEIEDFLVEPY